MFGDHGNKDRSKFSSHMRSDSEESVALRHVLTIETCMNHYIKKCDIIQTINTKIRAI